MRDVGAGIVECEVLESREELVDEECGVLLLDLLGNAGGDSLYKVIQLLEHKRMKKRRKLTWTKSIVATLSLG